MTAFKTVAADVKRTARLRAVTAALLEARLTGDGELTAFLSAIGWQLLREPVADRTPPEDVAAPFVLHALLEGLIAAETRKASERLHG